MVKGLSKGLRIEPQQPAHLVFGHGAAVQHQLPALGGVVHVAEDLQPHPAIVIDEALDAGIAKPVAGVELNGGELAGLVQFGRPLGLKSATVFPLPSRSVVRTPVSSARFWRLSAAPSAMDSTKERCAGRNST